MTTVETTIQGNTTSHSTTSSETITNDFTNMHQTTNSVFVKQTTSDISKWKTSKTTFLLLLFTLELFFLKHRYGFIGKKLKYNCPILIYKVKHVLQCDKDIFG